MTRLRGQRPEMASAPPDPAVERLEPLRGEDVDRLVERGERLLAGPISPAARGREPLESERKARDRLAACRLLHGRMASGALRLGRGEDDVEAGVLSEPLERAVAEPFDEHVPVARLAEHGGDPRRFRPQRLKFCAGETP